MTTRNEVVARMMISRPTQDTIINLKGLSNVQCWNLFKQHAYDDSDIDEMRYDVVKKCNGLPLAAKTLGGLFKKTVDKRRRRMILESNIWSEESGVLLPVLRLSYDYLPSQLKRVFAYCSVFPKDYKFEKKEVILLWVAQGFLMEDLGHNFFDDLESRSLFEQCPYDEGRFIMHDLIHDLALWAAGGICYAKGIEDITKVNRQRIRHVYLTIHATKLESELLIGPHLRTFYGVGRIITNLEFIQRFSYIRAICLASNRIEVLPESIGDLKHLHFLSLKYCGLKELPKSINNLWNLQTMWLVGCPNLKKVPDIRSHKKLRHLKIEDCDSLQGDLIAHNPSLITLEIVRSRELSVSVSRTSLPLVEKLEVKYFKLLEFSSATMQVGHGLAYLTTLIIHGCPSLISLPQDLLLPGLQHLAIKHCKIMESLPSKMHKYTCLKILDIFECPKLECFPRGGLPENIKTLKILTKVQIKEGIHGWGLHRLHSLECLSLDMRHVDTVTSTVEGLNLSLPSSALRDVRILGIHTLKNLSVGDGTNLKILQIGNCRKLESLVVTKFKSPTTLILSSCPKLRSLPPLIPTSISVLELSKLGSCTDAIEHIPSPGLDLPYSLHELTIEGFHNLKTLSCSSSPNLFHLKLGRCPKFEYFVSLSPHLKHVEIEGCKLIVRRGTPHV